MKNLFFLAAVLWCIPPLPAQNRPGWTERKPPDTAEMSYFTSRVDECHTEDEAIRSAINNVNNAVANSTIVYIRSLVSERSRNTESQAEFSINIETDSYTDVILSGIKTETYSEGYTNRSGRRRYQAWALASVSKVQAEENRRLYMEAIAKRYTLDSAVQGDNLAGALSAYGGVYQALEQNPLHRTIAVYGDGQSLFEYCRQKISEIANSLSFNDIPPQSVQKGGVLTVPVRVSSSIFANTAALTCAVTLRSGNRTLPGGEYTVGGDNSFLLRLPTAALEPGNYETALELKMNTPSSGIVRNPRTSFRLSVRPASAELKFGGETLSGAEQRMFSQAVQTALQEYHVPLLAGYEFLLTFTIRPQTEPVAGTRVLICDISISLNSAGSVLFQSAPARITEISRDQAIKRASEHIRGDRAFWTGAARLTQSEE
ncbi:MAG: hypothetical protein LBO65_01430 [Spirochaetaceae bacterium]|jgi:hypothetical protein|nr:hypothetical protein [Spirochaetaceae bacterium]